MERKSEPLSTAEMYVIVIKKYGNKQEGLENWKTDLYKFVTPKFHDMLNSSNLFWYALMTHNFSWNSFQLDIYLYNKTTKK